jgi:hypothetical protein
MADLSPASDKSENADVLAAAAMVTPGCRVLASSALQSGS